MQKFLMFSVFSVLFLCNQVFGVLYSGPFKSDGSNLPPGAVTKNYSTSTTVTINATGSQNALNVVGTSNISSLLYVNYGTGYVGIGTSLPNTLLTVNGVASFGAGTAALPSITAFWDLNTGAWFPAADTFAVSTGGSERFRVTSAGNVGIGTSSPTQKLDVVGASGLDGSTPITLRLNSTENNNWTSDAVPAQILFSTNDATGGAGYAGTRAAIKLHTNIDGKEGRLSFWTTTDGQSGLTERMRITAAGNVGIGTTDPNASAILDVQSTTKGFRLPNMTSAQMYDIVSPAAGLMIWNTSSVNVSVYTGSAWANVKDL